MVKEPSSFYPMQQTGPLSLISKYRQLWQEFITCPVLLGTAIITVTVFCIQKDISIHVVLKFFFNCGNGLSR
jgi:hypothetical protein